MCDTNNYIIGQGNYSVVLCPVVKNISKLYVEYTDANDTDIAKVFKLGNEEDFTKELEILQEVKTIPDYMSFTVPVKGASKFKVSELPYDIPLMTNLNVLYSSNSNKELHQIIFGYGGVELTKIKYNIPFLDFLMLFKDFLYGMQKLQAINIVHRDIKPTNVLIQGRQLNIIDFGLACRVDEVYANTDDNNFVLSYKYMYHPPEFYIAYLLHENDVNSSFDDALELAFKNMISYTTELKMYYEEHFYKYNNHETYNIFSYKQAFHDFYKDIKTKNITSIQELFTPHITLKADIYAISYILKTLKKHLIFDNIFQRQVFNTLYDMTYELNPYQRASLSELISYIETVFV